MKQILLTGLFALPMVAFSQTTLLSENFDAYTVGGTVAAQSSVFETWSGTTPEDAFVADTFSASASNSMNVYNNGATAYLHDMVMPFPSTYTTGIYEFKLNMYITSSPASYGGYFNLGGAWAAGGAGYVYGVDVFFNADGSIHTSQGGATTGTFSMDTWFAVSVMVDIDAGTYDLSIDGTSAQTGTWAAAGVFGVADIFGVAYDDVNQTNEITSNFYVDDVELVEWSTGTTGIAEVALASSMKVVPNPSNGNFVLNYSNLSMDNPTVSLTNVLGQTIYSRKINTIEEGSVSFNMDLRNGVYFVTISEGSTKITKKIIVR